MFQILAAIAGTIITINVHAMTTTITIMNGVLKEDSSGSARNSSQNITTADFTITLNQAAFYGTLNIFAPYSKHFALKKFEDCCTDQSKRSM